ncbi:hypothetical protein [Rhizobium laguerreae]|uniref:hypothetical protein n=1 Tax=Rhizobium laguerreae TaxID=1076926 RepID=UPI001C923123|nr:hypothetical protein [Rhizobium laguerreae]MBY3381693.1 hypothetical protein [Rhizobium laguerreae]
MKRPELPEVWPNDKLDQLTQLPLAAQATLVIASASFAGSFHDRRWLVALEGSGTTTKGVLAGGTAGSQDLIRLLSRRKAAIDSGDPTISLATLLVGVNTLRDLAQHMRNLLPTMSSQRRDRALESYGWDKLIWYASGDYIGLLQSVSGSAAHITFQGLALSFSRDGELGVGRAPEARQQLDLVLHLADAEVGGSKVRFVRILDPLASGYVMIAENEIVAEGRGSRRQECDGITMMQLARIVGLISSIWPEY